MAGKISQWLEHRLLFKRTQVWFLEPTSQFTSSITLGPWDSIPASGLWGPHKTTYLCIYMYAKTLREIPYQKQLNGESFVCCTVLCCRPLLCGSQGSSELKRHSQSREWWANELSASLLQNCLPKGWCHPQWLGLLTSVDVTKIIPHRLTWPR